MQRILVIALSAAVLSPAWAQQFHLAPPDAPATITIADSAEPGSRLVVRGRVLDGDGRPVTGASIYAYHTDATGVYVPGGAGAAGNDRPRLYGYLRSDADGRYAFSTIKPGPYPAARIPAHVHFEVAAPGHADRTYEIVFADDPFLSSDFRARARDPLGAVAIVTGRPGAGGTLEVSHDIRLRAR